MSVGGDHGLFETCANAAGAAPRFEPLGAVGRPPGRATTNGVRSSATKATQPGAVVVTESAVVSEPEVVPGSETVREPLVVRDLEAPAIPRARSSEQSVGTDAGFREYVTARSHSLLRTAYLLTGNAADAEDLVQAALAKTFLAWDRIEDRGALDGYVRRAMVNTHISWWRRRRVEEYPTDEIPDQAVADHAVASDLQETLRRAIDRLPHRMRAAVVLRYYEDMTEAEVAEVLGVSLGTVKSTVSRAVAKLRTDADLQSD